MSEGDAKALMEEAQRRKNGGREPDLINHPPHYQSGKGMEVIDVIEAFELDFSLGNCVKYVLRAGKKTGETTLKDLKKAAWYLQRRIDALDKPTRDEVIDAAIKGRP